MSKRMTKPTNYMCAKRRLRSSVQSDQRPIYAQCSSGRQRRLWLDWTDVQADLNLRWAHMPFCRLFRTLAHIHVVKRGIGGVRNCAEARHCLQNCMCAKRRQLSLCIHEYWSESSLSAWTVWIVPVPYEDSDQTARIRSPIWVLAGHTWHLVGNAGSVFSFECSRYVVCL